MAELLLELFSEEIPSRMQLRAAEELRVQITSRLSGLEVAFSNSTAYVTPRRLVLVIDGIPAVQPDVVVEKKGPRVGAAPAAVEGFLRSAAITEEQMEVRSTDKGDFYFAVIQQKGLSTAEIIVAQVKEVLQNFVWPKSMRWGDREIRWVRPLQNILCVFDGKILPLEFGHLQANRLSFGHRFLAPGSFEVRYFADYRASLRERFVILDTEERKAIIEKNAQKLAADHGLTVKPDKGLLEEVAGLVEWPVVLMGKIDESFMTIPGEVLATSMRSHQKYFSLLHNDGSMAPYFIVVSNMQPQDQGAKIIAGNERVLRARLADAKFFWEQDRKQTLTSRLPQLSHIIFHTKLGTVGDKAVRVAELAQYCSVWVPHAKLPLVSRAATLAKCDLVSEMVLEFPELQGVMGGYYAGHDHEDPEVAKAVADHYKPLGPSDSCPTGPVSVAVALADKIDTLAGLFAADEKPTGSKDPFALRRAALGVIRIILENGLHIPLTLVLEKAITLYPNSVLKSETEKVKAKVKRLTTELLEFFADRLKASLKSQSVRHDLINAVFDSGNEDDLLRLVNRVLALQNFLSSAKGASLLAAYRRASNIVSIEEMKDNATYNKEPQKDRLIQREELALFAKLEGVKPQIAVCLKENDFMGAMALLDELEEPINQFFDQVIVNCENSDIRKNRLRILSQIRGLLGGVANFENIES